MKSRELVPEEQKERQQGWSILEESDVGAGFRRQC